MVLLTPAAGGAPTEGEQLCLPVRSPGGGLRPSLRRGPMDVLSELPPGSLTGSLLGSRDAADSVRVTQWPSLGPWSPFQHCLQRAPLTPLQLQAPPQGLGTPPTAGSAGTSKGPAPPLLCPRSSAVRLLLMRTGPAGPWPFSPEPESTSSATVWLEGPSQAPGL